MLVALTFLGLLGAEAPKEPAPVWPLPWKEGVNYELTWYEKEPTGKSVFVCRWSEDKKSIVCKASVDVRGRGPRIEGAFVTQFSPDLSPLGHVSQFKGGTAKNQGTVAGIAAKFSPAEIVVKLGLSENAPSRKFEPPKERYWLYANQSIHHWAIFLTALDTTKPSRMKLFLPDFLEFMDIAFTPEGIEELRGAPTTRLAFETRLFQGKIWVDRDKRLVRYQQKTPVGLTEIWVDEKKA